MSKRITIFINSLRAGGAEGVCVTIANALQTNGWEVNLLLLNRQDAVLLDRLNKEVVVHDLGVAHARIAAPKLFRYLKHNTVPVILVFNHQLAILLLMIRFVGRIKLRIVARNISTLSLKKKHHTSLWHKHIVHWLTKLIYRQVDGLIAQSSGMRDDLVRNFGFSPAKIEVIPNPLRPSFAEGPPPVTWAARERALLFVGRLHAVKGLELLLDASARVFNKHPDLLLRIVGDGPDRNALQAYARKLGCDGKVVFEGYTSDPAPLIRSSILVLLTSHYEGFPNVLIEAFSQGTPVVSVDCPSGPAEVIQDGVNGYLVKGRASVDFAAAIERAVGRAWSPAQIAATVERFQPEPVIARYEWILSSIAGKT